MAIKLEKLAPEQEALMLQIREEWLDLVFKNSLLDKQKAIDGVKFLYSLAKLPEPLIIIVDSPLGCQYAANILGDQVGAQVGDQVGAQVWDQVGAQVGDQVGAQVGAQVWDQVGAQVWDQVGAQVWDQVGAQVRDQVRDQVWAQVGAQVRDQQIRCFTSAEENILFDAGWVSFYDYFRRIGIVDHGLFDQYMEHIKNGVFYTIFLKGVVILCGRPKYIKRDDFYRLHCADGPAILWPDGYANYFWHSIPVTQKLIETPDKIDKDDLMREENAEVRRAMKEKLGDRFFKLLDVREIAREVVGSNGYAREAVLFRTNKPDPVAEEHIQFVQVTCHSTCREYTLCVPPNLTNPLAAVAWTFGKAGMEYAPAVEA